MTHPEDATKAGPLALSLHARLGLSPEGTDFGELLKCRMCGGEPYPYDLRETHDICTVECGTCDHDAEADTPEAAAIKWNFSRA